MILVFIIVYVFFFMNEWLIVMFNKFVNVVKEKFLWGEILNDVLIFIVVVKRELDSFDFK